MSTTRPVNEVLDQLAELDGTPVQLEGVLQVHEEGYEVQHYPKAQRRPQYTENSHSYQAGIWLAFGTGSIQPNAIALKRWQGKRVRVSGFIRSLASLPPFGSLGKGGFGPWGFWPAEIETYSVQRVTAEERRENDA